MRPSHRKPSSAAKLAILVVALLAGAVAYAATPGTAESRPKHRICAGDFPGTCVYTWEPITCIEPDAPWTVCMFER